MVRPLARRSTQVTKYIVGLIAAFAFSVAYAEAPASVKLTAKNGDVTFEHAKHKALDCTKCHADAKGGKIRAQQGQGARPLPRVPQGRRQGPHEVQRLPQEGVTSFE
ncbi:MAG: cytochrome c3 family protein [Anaeromyxobacteraceae bacterium]